MKTLSLVVLFASVSALGSEANPAYTIRNACSDSEKWDSAPASEILNDLLGRSPLESFSIAWVQLKIAESAEKRLEMQYFVARGLYLLDQNINAHGAMAEVARLAAQSNKRQIQLAAIECIEKAERKSSALGAMGFTSPELLIGLDASHSEFVENQRLRLALRGLWDSKILGQPVKPFEKFLLALQKQDWSSASESFLQANQKEWPIAAKQIESEMRLQAARALAGARRLDESEAQYHAISRNANEWVDAIQELSWTQLLRGRRDQSIGTAVNLQQGAFKRVFAPESAMVLAMSLNELCQYPEAMKSLEQFRKDYQPIAEWFQKNAQGKNVGLQDAISWLKAPNPQIPVKIRTEVLREAQFLRSQEINIHARKSVQAQEQGIILADQKLNLKIQELLKRIEIAFDKYQKEKIKQGPGDSYSASLIREVQQIRKEMWVYRQIRKSKPILGLMAKSSAKKIQPVVSKMNARADSAIKGRLARMDQILNEVVSNMELVEIEVYRGAGQDMVWKNANPNAVKELQNRTAEASAGWNWGRSKGLVFDEREVWEDEVGSTQVDLADHCQKLKGRKAERSPAQNNNPNSQNKEES